MKPNNNFSFKSPLVMLGGIFVSALLLSCNGTGQKNVKTATSIPAVQAGGSISVPEANQMITAYLRHADSGETRSLFCNADTLRALLGDKRITLVKFFLARKASATRTAGTADTAGQLTLVIAGVDSSDRYVLGYNSTVLDELLPCPYECPPGEAGQDLISEGQ